MRFGFTAEEEAFRLDVRGWLQANLPADWGSDRFRPPADREEEEALLRGWNARLFEGGWAGLSWPREYGGAGATLAEQAIFLEERERARAPYELNIIGIGMAGPMLMDVGSAEQKRRYLQPMLSGEEIWCQGFSEPDAGSDLASLRTRARRDGDDYVIHGQKVWTSRADVADLMLLLARTDPEAPKHRGISAFIVDLDTPGLTLNPIEQITGVPEFFEVFFDDARVPAERLIGPANEGWQIAMRTLQHERVSATRVFDLVRLYRALVEQLAAAPGGAPAAAWDRLAGLYAEIHASRCAYFRGLTRIAGGAASGIEGPGGKLFSSELSKRLVDLALSLLGADAARGEIPLTLGAPETNWRFEYLNAFKHTIAAGTSEILLNIIGERVLGLPR